MSETTFGRTEAEAMMEEYGYCKHSDCRDLVLAAHTRGYREALATHPQAPASPQPEAESQKAVAGCSHPCGDIACAVVCKEYQDDTIPWPSITSYAGGQSEDGAYAWVDVQLTDGPETTRFVRPTPSAGAPLPEQRQEAAEPVYWQWRRKNEPWSLQMTFNSEPAVTTDDSEKRALYAAPITQAVKVPLTEDEISDITDRLEQTPTSLAHAKHDDIVTLVREVEGHHGIGSGSAQEGQAK